MITKKLVFAGVIWALLVFMWAPDAHSCTKQQYKVIQQMSWKQHATLERVRKLGVPVDLQFTLMAIAWQESKAGKYLVNPDTMDFGVMGISFKSSAARNKPKGFQRNILAHRLINDVEFNVWESIQELLYWKKERKGNWESMVRSYNAGWKEANGENYLAVIKENVKMFQQCWVPE